MFALIVFILACVWIYKVGTAPWTEEDEKDWQDTIQWYKDEYGLKTDEEVEEYMFEESCLYD